MNNDNNMAISKPRNDSILVQLWPCRPRWYTLAPWHDEGTFQFKLDYPGSRRYCRTRKRTPYSSCPRRVLYPQVRPEKDSIRCRIRLHAWGTVATQWRSMVVVVVVEIVTPSLRFLACGRTPPGYVGSMLGSSSQISPNLKWKFQCYFGLWVLRGLLR